MPATLKDISEKTGFSITTVSRALAGYNDVNEQTRQTIIRISQELGYQPNLIARQLQSRRTNTLGIVLPAHEGNLEDDFFSQLMLSVGRAASHLGYDLLIASYTSPEQEMQAYTRFVGGNRVDGLVLARTRRDDPRIKYLSEQQHPFVVSGRLTPDESENFPYVDLDSQRGVEMLVNHLLGLGHQHIGLILPPPNVAFTPYRYRGYVDGLTHAHLPIVEDYIYYGNLDQSSGYEIANSILNQHPQMTAIVACNDLMAIGALSALQERNLTPGVDISVVGFDDIPSAALPPYLLTTIHQPIYKIGQSMVEMLVQVIEGNDPSQFQVLLEPELVVRASSGSVSGSIS